jgi:hypothetical protein
MKLILWDLICNKSGLNGFQFIKLNSMGSHLQQVTVGLTGFRFTKLNRMGSHLQQVEYYRRSVY